ncbi:hypothetical protein U9K52_10020 [Chryseobacterium sp. MHB01]|uniref:hypothetical protein n=1 Tax=Chryseobacterium sp. MHB01 TaxID=3109433 RepID=UPI002AFEF4B6|nr:hypothetical protein [Chryseobacterium sp. MHB01]MEA1849249.1 hypothetical protein [Chryseobacterium sp. MHB01]
MANLNKNNAQTIWGRKIIRVSLNRTYFWGMKKTILKGHFLLEDGVFIQIKSGQYLISIEDKYRGVVLKSSPSYKIIKRLIAIEFKTFRKGSKASLIDKIPDLRLKIKERIDNCKRSNLLKHAS